MSTVSVTNVKNASSSVSNAVTTSGGDLTNAAGVSFMGGSKNLLYNGAMQVAQRGTSATGQTGSTVYNTADRWALGLDSLGTWTQTIENDAPTGSGLRKSLKMLCTTANASPSAGAIHYINQSLEGQDVQRIAKGTASAQQLTLSFWVKSNVTGTYICTLEDNDNSRTVSAAYTISASATWEKKSVTFPADTTGAFDNDNALSLKVGFGLGAGSTYTGGTLKTTWGSGYSSFMTGQTNLAAATNNYWQITGVQLEVGPVATSFEFKSFGQELRECQRYYARMVAGGADGQLGFGIAIDTTNAHIMVPLPQIMRVAPTAVDNANIRLTDFAAANFSFSGLALNAAGSSQTFAYITTSGSSGLTQYRSYGLRGNNNAAGYIGLSAEL